MISKRIEQNIRETEAFLEFWKKFHDLYKEVISKDIITRENEKNFFDTKDLMGRKYEELTKSFEFRYMPYNRLSDPVTEVLALRSLTVMSDEKSKRLEEDWRDSYVFLNNILERLKGRRRRLERFNPVGVFMKRFFEMMRKGEEEI